MYLRSHEKRLNSRYWIITNPLSSFSRRGSSKTSWLLLIFCFTVASSFSSSSASSPNESKLSFLHCAKRNSNLKQSERNRICIMFYLPTPTRWCSTGCGKKLTLQLSSLYLYSQHQLWFGSMALKMLLEQYLQKDSTIPKTNISRIKLANETFFVLCHFNYQVNEKIM